MAISPTIADIKNNAINDNMKRGRLETGFFDSYIMLAHRTAIAGMCQAIMLMRVESEVNCSMINLTSNIAEMEAT